LPPALESIPSPSAPNGYNAYESGDLLPIGTHCFQYEATDASGNLSSCDWCVNIVENPGPYANLSCNANINVSVDANCEAIITADMVLEGGPYGCYENYNVTVSGISPASAVVGNGTNAVIIKASQIDGWEGGMFGPFDVSVSDPNDANNSCWNGGWMLEDKMAPTIECDTITISCLTDIAPGGATSTGAASGSNADQTGWGDGDTGVVGAFDIEVSGIPAGASTDKVTVDISLDHSWMGDVTINLTSPSGQTVTLVDGNCGINDNINATFDSDAANPISCAAGATAGPHENCPGDFATFATINNSVQAVGDLSVFAGEAANGTWTVEVIDGVGGDGGCLDAGNFSINAAWTLQGTGGPNTADGTVVENCGQFELTHDDNVTNFDCTTGAPFVQVVERTWTVIDEKGNSASCVQVINVTASTLADLTLPPNYDNLDQAALDCSNADTDPSNTGTPEGSCSNISSTHTDLVFDEICEGSYKILRQWTVLDWCTGDILEHNQTIKVLDTTAPVFGAIADLNESTTTNSCEANVVLPAADLSDDCSDASNVSYVASASAGTLLPANGGYVLYGLPIGTHTVTYEATDDCGNTSTTSFNIIVTDEIVPVTICETFHVVSLTTNEPTLIYATTFDDGSYDNCEVESMEVRRMTPPTPCIDFDWTTNGPGIDELPNGIVNQRDRGMTFWYPAVPFACCDVNGEHLVEFRVTDVSGNSNTCMVTVEVDDKLDPVINCPANATYECSEYINESSDIAIDGLNQNGVGAEAFYVELNGPGNADNDTTFVGYYAAAFDNCEVTVYIRDAGTINSCGITEPFINRFFTAIDGGGRTDVCVQRLTVVNSTPYTGPLSFPTDKTYTTCDDLPDSGEPNISNDNTCSQVAVTYEDLELPVVDGSCYKILRTWYVIDWCQYDGNGAGQWSDTQIIKVINSTSPEFDTCESPATFAINSSTGGSCLATVTLSVNATDDCTPAADLNYTYWIDAFNDGTQDIGGNTATFFSTQIPAGTHSIKWTVEDGCGNITVCEYLFTAADLDGPTVYADDISVDLAQADEADVWASDLDAGSYDNCSDICDMRIGVPSQGPGQTAPPTADHYVFDCDDLDLLGFSIPVDLWVKDCANNWAYATVLVNVSDNSESCGSNPTNSVVSGTIGTETGAGVNNVTVNLTSNAPGVMPTMTTDASGAYTFGALENDMNYTVTPDMDLDPLNGVSTYDLVLISKHILQTQLLDSPYKMIAADVNMNGSVTTLDMVELRKLILFIETEFPVESSTWRFVETNFVFPNAANPFQTVFPEETFINGLTADVIADYVAVKKGDVNGSATTGFAGDAEGRSFNGELIFNVADRNLVAGNTYTVDFTSNDFNNIMGYQFSLAFDQNVVEVADVQSGELAGMSNGNFGMSKINEGVITTSWNNSAATSMVDNQTVFSVTFTAKNNAKLSEVFNVSSRLTAAEAYNANLDLMNVAIEYNDNNNEAVAEFTLLQNTPNPFKGQTVIGFMLPTAANATLSVYDISGKVIRVVNGDFVKGYNEVTMDRSELNSTGVLYYQLETAEFSATKKMIILE
jgi:subtilisin-like proprotein convertase family protein